MIEQINNFLKDVYVMAIVCNQWGDTGKGKFVDLFAAWADIIVRGTGGANAGHTISINGVQYVFHLIPSGILYDNEGKKNLLGPGVAFDPKIAKEELELLVKNGKTFDNLFISYNSKLLLPQHIVMDSLKDNEKGETKIGTTKRGIGPLYTDHYARIGLTVNDMLNKDILRTKIERNLRDKRKILSFFDPEAVKESMNTPNLDNGIYYKKNGFFDVDTIVEKYYEYGSFFKEKLTDTNIIMKKALADKDKILLEGAQGHLLGVDYGSYPFVTSSDCSIEGLSKGAGIHEKYVDLVLGIVKAFYMTRVGFGAFPTELGGDESDKWCGKHTKEEENNMNASINDTDEFKQGVAIRQEGEEYGATTGRPRRTGWLDLPLLRYAKITNGSNVVLTKLDVLNECEEIKICDHYTYEGPDYNLGNKVLKNGDKIYVANLDNEVLKHCKSNYKIFDGWLSDISNIKSEDELPKNLLDIVNYVEKSAGVNTKIYSVGPDRNQTIFR